MPDFTNVPGVTSQSLLTAEQAKVQAAIPLNWPPTPPASPAGQVQNQVVAQQADH